jgi:hypothetical protein
VTIQTRSGVAYVQLRRDSGVRSLRVVRMTQKEPESVEHGCIVVKMRFEVPDGAWSVTEVAVMVPADLPVIQAELEPAGPSR